MQLIGIISNEDNNTSCAFRHTSPKDSLLDRICDIIQFLGKLNHFIIANCCSIQVLLLPSKYPTVEALLARADGEYPNGGKKEGIVIRPTEPVFCPLISASLSMKVVSNKYLLKNDA